MGSVAFVDKGKINLGLAPADLTALGREKIDAFALASALALLNAPGRRVGTAVLESLLNVFETLLSVAFAGGFRLRRLGGVALGDVLGEL